MTVRGRKSYGWSPFLSYAVEQGGEVELLVASGDKDVTYTLFQYVWTAAPSS
jgi:hypothetical protein